MFIIPINGRRRRDCCSTFNPEVSSLMEFSCNHTIVFEIAAADDLQKLFIVVVMETGLDFRLGWHPVSHFPIVNK